MKAIIYSRVSGSQQSTERQVNELKELKEFEIIKVFTESISGYTKSIKERPELQNALNYVKVNDIEVILVHEISRLGRRTAEVLTLIESLKRDGIKLFIKSLGITINGNGATEAINKLIITLMADLARMESEQLSYRIKSGIEERKRKGFKIGRQYDTIESKDQFLKKHRKVVKYLNAGESIRWISNQLKMSPTTVQKVKNAVYSEKER